MCSFEGSLRDASRNTKFLSRFVDDSCSRMPGVDASTDFSAILNELHPSLNYTLEIAFDGKLPILGILHRKSGTVLTNN